MSSSLSVLMLLSMLLAYIGSAYTTWALQDNNNYNQYITKENSFVGPDKNNKMDYNETGLTAKSQDDIVNKIISIFNEPISVNRSSSAQTCTTHDFRCCILNSKSCVPVATITSVTDGDGKPIPLRGVTSSKEIMFTFTSFIKFGGAGFECSLDQSTFHYCTSPYAVNHLVHTPVNYASKHEFEVRMLGMDAEDSPKATFIWFYVQK